MEGRLRRAEEDARLKERIEAVTAIAREMGLDFFPMRYHIIPADVMLAIGASGMPTRFSHWQFGKAFYRMKLHYDLGLSKIYELVINSDPCEAFLYEGNSLLQNTVIVAHVLAHSDFFKNNVYYSRTNRRMVDSMAASAERIRRYEIAYGERRVEAFLDAALSIQEHIDPYGTARETGFWWEDADAFYDAAVVGSDRRIDGSDRQGEAGSAEAPARGGGCVGGGDPPGKKRRWGLFADLWALDERLSGNDGKRSGAGGAEAESPARRRFPPEPEKDVLLFILRYSTALEPWQRDILTIVHDEMRYFWPQLETKIMNEGWATYWHRKIMQALPLSPEEAIEFARMHAEIVKPYPGGINPYLLGWKMFEAIEAKSGREGMFEAREFDNDASFIRNHLTEEVVRELDLFVYGRKDDVWRVETTDWTAVREALIRQRIGGGFPIIVVADGDFERRGELLLRHVHDGPELDVRSIERTLPHVHRLWGRPVHLETVLEGRPVRFSYDGIRHDRTVLA
ncbi:MAG: SpoVR family protein [Hydrogenibacillus schlegelii]|nr:SpoVR family protein [Hydrogenibacillus schlegelii]